MADWRSAPVGDTLRSTLGLLQKLTLTPERIEAADVRLVLATGVTPDQILDAMYVCMVFNVIDRLSDALGFDVPPPDDLRRGARLLLKIGYR